TSVRRRATSMIRRTSAASRRRSATRGSWSWCSSSTSEPASPAQKWAFRSELSVQDVRTGRRKLGDVQRRNLFVDDESWYIRALIRTLNMGIAGELLLHLHTCHLNCSNDSLRTRLRRVVQGGRPWPESIPIPTWVAACSRSSTG